jgi:capsular polysaccharide biosynthesis protein
VAIQGIATTFAVMIPSEPIARDAVERTGVNRSPNGVAGSTYASVIPGTTLIQVVVADPDAAVAQALANGITDAFVERAQELEPGTAAEEGALPTLPAYVFQRAQLPTVPQSTSSSSRLVVGALFGLAVALAIAFLLDYLDITVRTPAEVESRVGLPVLGSIPSGRSPDVLVGASRPPPAVQAVEPDVRSGV